MRLFSKINILGGLLTVAGLTTDAQDIKRVDVLFATKKDTIAIGATITSPKGNGRYPALVLVSGTGPQDRDATMAGTKMFAQVAEDLSAKGYVVLRMDDRGVGKTTGNYQIATTSDFANDALEALAYLKTLSSVDTNRIGLLGHSEGGAAISIAASRSNEVAFLVSLAGLATNGMESLFEQNESIVRNGPQTTVDKNRSNEINRLMFAIAYQYAESDSLEARLNETYNYWKMKDDIYFKTLGIEHDHFRFPVYSYVNYAVGPWYRYFVRYNAEAVLGHVDVPILAINGDSDLFVGVDNLKKWKTYSKAGQAGKVTTVLLPKTNHLMQECVTCDTREYTQLKAMPQSTLDIISQWLNKTIK